MLKPVPKTRKPIVTRVVNSGDYLATRPDMPVDDALEHSSCLVNAAKELARDLAMTNEGSACWPIFYLLENAQALIDASAVGLRGEPQ